MSDERISVIDAAQQVGLGKQAVFKIIKRLGIETFKERHTAHGGQAIAYITLDDFALLQEDIGTRNLGMTSEEPDDVDLRVDAGVFYLLQLEPEHDPGRFKVGFAVSMADRLRTHKCSAPFAVTVKTWQCKRLWERTAIDCVTADCEQLHTEVFRCDNLDSVVAKCDQFFAIMPSVTGEETTDR